MSEQAMAVKGDTAIIQPAEVNDLIFYLVKDERDAGRWKLSAKRMTESWTDEQFRDRIGLIQTAGVVLREYTNGVATGKYATLAEQKRDLAPVLRQNR